MHNVRDNPFVVVFQEWYEKVISGNVSHEVILCIKDLLHIDEEEIIHYMTNELGNTLTLYTSKLKDEQIQTITLLIDTPDDEYFIPSIILASAYASFEIKSTFSSPHTPLLPKMDNMYHQLAFGKNIFFQFGGCDLDMISDVLFDIISLPDIAKSGILQQMQTLVIIKILELMYNSCLLLMKGDRFAQLPKTKPFAFFAHLNDKDYIRLVTFT
ncbi:MAG TPA: hypothetical protein PL059_09430 [Spirochaetota bacterium]|nr:hypothetical protein [Spirochaetota bacterium]HOM11259.1 hypothetical protein [Spirochaetota bacterium]HPP50068.1 hypothetical protein [Spirochaetota bacterium]